MNILLGRIAGRASLRWCLDKGQKEVSANCAGVTNMVSKNAGMSGEQEEGSECSGE